MTNIEITNMILEFFISRGIKTRIRVNNERKDETHYAPVIQIDVDFKGQLSEQFAFFYFVDDSIINFSVIYKMKQPLDGSKFRELADSIRDQIAPFEEFVKTDDDAYLFELFREMKTADFSGGLLEELLNLFTEKDGVIEKLRSMSDGF